MRINNNIMAMNTHRQLGIAQQQGARSMEKLSSGLRINNAADDAAGLAISEKMRGQIRGLNQASRNAQDGVSLIQTAEGAMNETHAILQRMRELAVQASSDTNVDVDRDEIQQEINQLTSEINRIGNATEFNTMKLMDGSLEMSDATSASILGDGVTGTVKILDAATAAYAKGVSVESPVDIHGAKAGKIITDLTIADAGAAAAVTTTADNNELSVRVTRTDGTTETVHVALEVKAYTGSEFATELQTKINNALSGADVAVSFSDDNKLQITTGADTGAGAQVEIIGGNAMTHLGNAANFVQENGMNTNKQLTIDYKDGAGASRTLNVDLDTKVYNTAQELVNELNSQNGANQFGTIFTASLEGDRIVITSDTDGSTFEITNISGSASSHLGLTNAKVTEGADVNNTIKFKVDGNNTEFEATLTAGEYNVDNASTREALAHQLQVALNAASTEEDVKVEVNGSRFQVISGTTGESSTLQITEAHDALGFNSTTKETGQEGQEEFLNFQIGANQGQAMALSISDMRSVALGISGTSTGGTAHGVGPKASGAMYTNGQNVTNGTDNTNTEYALDVTDHDKASAAVEVISQAIEKVSSERSKLGAMQNRLEHTISNLGTSSENLQAAEARIRDVDMAQEMMEMTRNNILQQASTAMLAQANQAPQSVLQLLG